MAVTFPIDNEFVPLTLDGQPFTAAIGDINLGSTDIVGIEDFPVLLL